jgi:hypothetical protein
VTDRTQYLGLLKKSPSDPDIYEGTWEFFNRNLDKIDAAVRAMGRHHHTGADSADATPTDPPELAVISGEGGVIPAGRRVYYCYTLVDENGLETAPSPEAFIDTPSPIDAPGMPAGLSFATTGGTLPPGTYFYKLAAYVDADTIETRPGQQAWIAVLPGSSTNRISFALPTLPAGADGFNVYRQKPGGAGYAFLETIDMTGMSPPSTFTDDGSSTDDCVRRPSNVNRTAGDNSIDVTLPGATPTVPDGFTWRLYRTYITGNWSNSLVTEVTTEVVEGSGVISPEFSDLGYQAGDGQPPSETLSLPQPSPVDLTDGNEVDGELPMGLVSGFPWQVDFNFAGALEAPQTGTFVWVCEFPQATIVGCRACLARDSEAFFQDVIVDVNKAPSSATPTFTTIYTDQDDRPRVAPGTTRGDRTTPAVQTLVAGDMLTVDLDQDGSGASAGDYDLTVTVFMIVHGFPGNSFTGDTEDY